MGMVFPVPLRSVCLGLCKHWGRQERVQDRDQTLQSAGTVDERFPGRLQVFFFLVRFSGISSLFVCFDIGRYFFYVVWILILKLSFVF